MNRQLTLFAALLTSLLASVAQAQGGNCFPECRPGYVCSPNNECVSICNPACSDTQICTAEARCIDDPAAQQVAPVPVQQQQPQQGYPQQPQQQQGYGAPPQQQQYQAVDAGPSGLAEPGSFRINLNFALAFGGEGKLENDGFEQTGDLNATFGFTGQGLFAAGSYFLVGPQVSFRSLELDGLDDRTNALGAGVALGAHYAIDAGSIAFDPFVVASIGLGVALSDDQVLFETGFGVDFGVRGGAHVWFTPTFGATVGLGYQLLAIFSDDTPLGDGATLTFGQFSLDLGIAIRLGA